jgi:hypothetical protein
LPWYRGRPAGRSCATVPFIAQRAGPCCDGGASTRTEAKAGVAPCNAGVLLAQTPVLPPSAPDRDGSMRLGARGAGSGRPQRRHCDRPRRRARIAEAICGARQPDPRDWAIPNPGRSCVDASIRGDAGARGRDQIDSQRMALVARRGWDAPASVAASVRKQKYCELADTVVRVLPLRECRSVARRKPAIAYGRMSYPSNSW